MFVYSSQIISGFESNIHKINEKDRNEARLKFVNCIENFSNQKQNSLNWYQKQLIQNSKSTDNFLKNNPDIYHTNTIHNKVNNIIKLWKSKNYINEKIAYSLKSSNPLPDSFTDYQNSTNPTTPSDLLSLSVAAPHITLPPFTMMLFQIILFLPFHV